MFVGETFPQQAVLCLIVCVFFKNYNNKRKNLVFREVLKQHSFDFHFSQNLGLFKVFFVSKGLESSN